MSTVKTKNVQVGTDGTASNNFTIYVPGTPDGTVRIGNGDAGAVTDAVTINSSGNVGVGTSSPSQTLHVVNGTSSGGLIQYDGKSNSEFGLRIQSNISGGNFESDFANGTTALLDLYANSAVTSGGDLLVARTQSATPVFLVKGNGSVGIGTSSPNTYGQLAVYKSSGNVEAAVVTDGANYATYRVQNSSQRYSMQIRTDQSNAFVIRDETNSANRFAIDTGGSVRIGTTASYGLNEKLALYGTSTANNPTIISDKAAAGTASSNHILFNNANGYVGSITTLNSGTAFNTSSDYRLKENVAPMSGSIDRLKQLKPSTWSWVQDGSHGEGFLAHEAQSVVPEAVSGTKDAMRTEEYEVTPAVEATYDEEGNELTPAVEAVMGTREVPDYQGIDQAKLVPLLTAALQEAITKIENLETRIEALEAK
jgi:hypothetical protein